jgi:hypothetical protein
MTRRRLGTVFTSYTKSLGSARKNARYIGFRKRNNEKDVYGVFSKDHDKANVKSFLKELDSKKTRNKHKAVAHRLLFTMSQDEWNRSGFEMGDYKQLVRDTLHTFEIETGKRLTWIAAEHHDDGHPHVHVLVKATYHDRDGVEHLLQIKPEERQLLREAFQDSKNYKRGFELEPPKHHEMNKDFTRPVSMINDLSLNHLKQELAKAEWQREMERSKHVNDNERSR